MKPEGRERIIFPLDVSSSGEAMEYAARLKGRVGLFKIGLELYVSAGPRAVEAVIAEAGPRIFLDLKFHDIPATVRAAARAASAQGVQFVSVHAAGGRDMLEAAVEGAGGKTRILAITALTSLGRQDLLSLGLREELADPLPLVLHRARLAKEAGCSGIVCSGKEAAAVKRELGNNFFVVVPGVRPLWGEVSRDDQERVTTPAKAVSEGADYIVIGRPIREASDPAAAADRIAAEIDSLSAAEEQQEQESEGSSHS